MSDYELIMIIFRPLLLRMRGYAPSLQAMTVASRPLGDLLLTILTLLLMASKRDDR